MDVFLSSAEPADEHWKLHAFFFPFFRYKSVASASIQGEACLIRGLHHSWGLCFVHPFPPRFDGKLSGTSISFYRNMQYGDRDDI